MQLSSKNGRQKKGFRVEVATTYHDPIKIAAVINAAYKKEEFLQEGAERIFPEEVRRLIQHTPHGARIITSPLAVAPLKEH